jgi:hypothetical protein
MASITTKVVRNARQKGVKVYTRKRWSKNLVTLGVYQWRRIFRRHKRVRSDTLWQHISVTHDLPDFTADMRLLHRIGMERFGSGMSYNVAFDMRSGVAGIGQAFDAAGTHTLNDKDIPNYSFNQNYVAHAFVFIGVPGDKPSDKCILNAARFMAAMMEEGALTPPEENPDYNPHSMVAFKECPTQLVRNVMPKIEQLAIEIYKKNR